jgi:sterol desaturase/sphingolipid hydroxylase (fatty acid hydroxylase superfamily)
MIPKGPAWVMFVQALMSQSVAYFALAGLLFIIVWKFGEQRFAPRRIQRKKRVNRQQILFEVRHTFVTLAVGTVTAVAISLLYAAQKTSLTTDAQALGWPRIILSFFVLLVLNDAWFYGWHRLLHSPRIFRYVHAVHHKSVDVNPFSSYSFHAVEGLILGGWIVPVVLWVPLYLPMLGALQGIGLLNNLMSHLGYEFLPPWLVRVPVLRWINTATFHSMHHSKLNGNYALMFRWLDQLFGTAIPEYERAFVSRPAHQVTDAAPAAPQQPEGEA